MRGTTVEFVLAVTAAALVTLDRALLSPPSLASLTLAGLEVGATSRPVVSADRPIDVHGSNFPHFIETQGYLYELEAECCEAFGCLA